MTTPSIYDFKAIAARCNELKSQPVLSIPHEIVEVIEKASGRTSFRRWPEKLICSSVPNTIAASMRRRKV